MERKGYEIGQSGVDWQIFGLRTKMQNATPEQQLELLCKRRELRAVARSMQQVNAALKGSIPVSVDDSFFK